MEKTVFSVFFTIQNVDSTTIEQWISIGQTEGALWGQRIHAITARSQKTLQGLSTMGVFAITCVRTYMYICTFT